MAEFLIFRSLNALTKLSKKEEMNQPIRSGDEERKNTDQSNEATSDSSKAESEILKQPIRSPETDKIEDRIPVNGSEITSMFSGLYCGDIPGDSQDRKSTFFDRK